MLKIFKNLFDSNEKQVQKIKPIIDKINSFEADFKKLSDEDLKQKTEDFRKTLQIDLEKARLNKVDPIKEKENLFLILPEAFALVKESADRFTQHKHFDVQLSAGYFLADNKITELFTGEGKTNAATLAMYLYGLTGRGAHLITVNDYLARRDGEWNGHVLGPLGLSVGIINSGKQYRFVSDEEAIALKGSIAEEEIKERDRLQKEVGRLKLDLMVGTNLIECSKKEAYDCDVVYGTNNEFGFDYLRDNMSRRLSDRVQSILHYAIVDEADSILIDEARTPLIISQSAQASNDMYKQFANIANELSVESDYVVDEKANSVAITDAGIDKVEKILKVDNVYEDPKFAYHLDNALKAKELYKKDDEYILRNGEIIIVDEFTGRALPGRRYSEGLHQAIEAKERVEVKRESKTLATITLQNYFRLYEHLAGMTATALTEAEEFSKVYKLDVVVIPTNRPVVRIDETDVVYRSEMGKFKAIVEDIKESNEKGQPVLVGTTSVERSEILSEMLSKEGINHSVLNAKQHEKEAKIVQDAGKKGQVTIATNMAGRGTDIALGEGVKELGGLYVIGSERHESRRIDNQLRGRSGRQGDPGKSRFYVSFDDELMRLFGGDRMKMIMSGIGLDEDIPVSLGLLGKTIENAQKRVEAHNFDIRKRLVEYDDVLNQQREIIYGLRGKILSLLDEKDVEAKNDSPDFKELKNLGLNALIEDVDGFSLNDSSSYEVSEFDKFPLLQKPMNIWLIKKYIEQVRFIVASQLTDDMQISNVEERKSIAQITAMITEELGEKASKYLGFDNLTSFYGSLVEDIKPVDLENKLLKLVVASFVVHIYEIGYEFGADVTRLLTLQTIDNYWMEHLDSMADLREGIGMQSLAQRDPLVAYKNEGFGLFEKMLRDIDFAIVNRFMKVRLVKESSNNQNVQTVHAERSSVDDSSKVSQTRARDIISRSDNRPGRVSKQHTIVNSLQRIGRNELCPCGSGKKYKKCHLDRQPETEEEQKAFRLFFEDYEEWKKQYIK